MIVWGMFLSLTAGRYTSLGSGFFTGMHGLPCRSAAGIGNLKTGFRAYNGLLPAPMPPSPYAGGPGTGCDSQPLRRRPTFIACPCDYKSRPTGVRQPLYLVLYHDGQ